MDKFRGLEPVLRGTLRGPPQKTKNRVPEAGVPSGHSVPLLMVDMDKISIVSVKGAHIDHFSAIRPGVHGGPGWPPIFPSIFNIAGF